VWTVVHSRFAEARNAMDPDSADALVQAFREFDADDSASVAVLWGEGGAFCAGWDLKFASTLSDHDAFQRHVVDGLAFPTGANPAPRGPLGPTRLELSKPVIAAVEGYALAGGCEIALACDLIVAARDATFGLPETKRSLVAGAGGLFRLPQRIPRAIAMEYALTGEFFSAEDAHTWGLVNRLTDPGEALAGALRLARKITERGPLAVRATKKIVRDGGDWPAEERWARQQEIMGPVMTSADAREGARAFAEKRAPVWTGK